MGAVASDPVALESFRAVGGWLGHGMADLAAVRVAQLGQDAGLIGAADLARL